MIGYGDGDMESEIDVFREQFFPWNLNEETVYSCEITRRPGAVFDELACYLPLREEVFGFYKKIELEFTKTATEVVEG